MTSSGSSGDNSSLFSMVIDVYKVSVGKQVRITSICDMSK